MDDKTVIFDKAINWIKNNSINNEGITVTSEKKVIYPEVTGYYIPTLLQWGERDLAVSYARYLCRIQKEDGSWYDSDDQAPYVFDSAQILKGLVSIYEVLPEVKENIIRGCDWLISNVNEEGRLTTPSKDAWGSDENFCSELIHVYCLTPLVDAARIFDVPKYKEIAYKILDYYKTNYMDKILNFRLLSHFYAYVMEGLYDLGEVDLVRQAMQRIGMLQDRKGGIPGLYDVKWVCSTGMFQLALVWYKLGELEKGNRIFDYACTLQNETGGWYGSYPGSKINALFSRGRKKAYYFPTAEISWANKYFLDALSYKMKLEFEVQSSIFIDTIPKDDGRYTLIFNKLKEAAETNSEASMSLKVCDVGCGKGRYLKNLKEDMPECSYFAVDLSEKVMQNLNFVEKRQGRLTQIPYEDEVFDYVYVCEALEHAINIEGALRELWRITNKDGIIVIIDKPVEKLGVMEIDEWEQWIDGEQIQKVINILGGKVEIVKSVAYESKDDGLFRAWIIKKDRQQSA